MSAVGYAPSVVALMYTGLLKYVVGDVLRGNLYSFMRDGLEVIL